MRRIFKNDDLEKSICDKGWAKVQLLGNAEIQQLIDFYLPRRALQQRPGTHYTLASQNYNFRKEVNQVIGETFGTAANNTFDNYRMLYANFMIKEPGPEGVFPIHQDWTYVHEPGFRSVAIWAALTDNDETTGCLHVVEGSHLWGDEPRGPFIPWKFEKVSEQVKQKLKPVPIHAGEAIIWDHRLIHASQPNISSAARMVATAIYVPAESQAIHFSGERQNEELMCMRNVDTDFFLRYTVQNMSEMQIPVSSVLPSKHHPYSETEFEQIARAK